MIRKIIIIVFLLSFSLGLAAQGKEGTALLDRLNLMFKDLAEKGSGGEAAVVPGLQALLADAKKAREENRIDAVFFRRYRRILMVLRLMVLEDNQGILSPLIERELGDFVEDVKGERIEMSGEKAIAAVAGSVAAEILDLHLYPERLKAREKLMKEFEKKYGVKK